MGRKHWEKEKLLIISNFSFSHRVFKRLVLQTGKNQSLFREGLVLASLQAIPGFYNCRKETSFKTLWEKGKCW